MIPSLVVFLAVSIAFALLLAVMMLRSWRRRSRRDRGLSAYPLPAQPAETVFSARVMHVATTQHDLPLERLVPAGLRFRAQGTLHTAPDGLTLDLAGSEPLFIPAEALCEVAPSSWAIGRGVERDGLSCVSWRVLGGPDAENPTIADSYFRVIDAAQRTALVHAISTLLPTVTTADANSEAQQ